GRHPSQKIFLTANYLRRMAERESAFIVFGLRSDLPQIIIFTLRYVVYDGHYAKKTNRPKWYFLALRSLLVPPNATCLNPAF
ncbi:MAG: hypothetical protein WCI51_11445, partial [Lentisphaerota bacterium]